MAIVPETEYSGKIEASSVAYPYGKARNITVPGDGTGTPWEKALANDIFGMQQALLDAAGITPSGVPDAVGTSDYLDALQALFGLTVTAAADGGVKFGQDNLILNWGGGSVADDGFVYENLTYAYPTTGLFVIATLHNPLNLLTPLVFRHVDIGLGSLSQILVRGTSSDASNIDYNYFSAGY